MMSRVSVGFALTQHCNLRCPHCIRDDVTTFAELDVDLVMRVLDEARQQFDYIAAGFTGGEPMLHREWPRLIEALGARQIPYTFVSNGWHMRRFMPQIDRHAPYNVRLSLSGADESVHDEERGRDSFRRVLLATALLTSRRVPVSYSMIVDRRTRHQLEAALRLGQQMGVMDVHFILAQPVPASAERDTDLGPAEWWAVRHELAAMVREASGGTRVIVDYGAPFIGPAFECDSKTLTRIYVDVHGRLSTCCQLSEYGANEADVVADLHTTSFADGFAEHVRRVAELKQISEPAGVADGLADFPCLRCARATGKLNWLRHYPDSPWAFAAPTDNPPALVAVSYSPRARRTVSEVA
jgi:MoaA/NifB/PqqE/SkfB family radical SAM enzyme